MGLCGSSRHLLCRPLQLPCGHHMCAQCLRSKIKTTSSLQCDQCSTQHALQPESIVAPSSLLLDLLSEQVAKCTTCGEGVQIKHLEQHIKSSCSEHISINASQMLKKSLTAPLSRIEERVTSTLVRRKISCSENPSMLTIQTGGPVSGYSGMV